MNLPTKDKKGNSFTTYSQILTFKRSKEDYYNQYILKTPYVSNVWGDFGNKVGTALEHNDFSKFDKKEAERLRQVTRLYEFEKGVFLRYPKDGFYLAGAIDTNTKDLAHIIDYKTGGKGKDRQYMDEDYSQLQTYALAIRQDTGLRVKTASVEFITRSGNPYKGESLKVADKDIVVIEQDLSEERLKHVYWDILRTAKEIEKFYIDNQQ